MLTIGVDNRLWGADSFLESAKYPKTTFSEIQRTFGQKFDADLVSKFKEERYVTNEFVADERGYVAWKVTKPAMGDEESEEQILYNEEVMAMLLGYVKMLAEKQAGGSVRDCVITIPSWFTYEQRLMVKDAAEGLAGLNVLQLVHENTAAATMFAIDHRAKIEPEKNLTVLFYNMGGMDTEVLIA
jgi:molecular chaperone DnaK (HSP70)|tara:strand:- start:159 stop:713 length:555 start_codon:yes stop_codon:yes gene_type:complete